jgi:prevent-host-death family protein
MDEISISEFKARCLALLEQVNKTKRPLRITRHGKPVAEVVPSTAVADRAALMGSRGVMLQRQRRIRLPADLSDWLSKSTAGICEAPRTHEIALASQRLTVHADSADRFIAATAQVLDLILVTD